MTHERSRWGHEWSSGQSSRQLNCVDQARLISHALTSYVERGAMINRGPDNRKSQSNIDRLSECSQLDRDQPLVVVTRDDDIETPVDRLPEHSVRRKGTHHINPTLSS